MMRIVIFKVVFVLVVILNSFNCDTTNGESKCCANTTDQRIVVEFTSNVVQHEYIVQFKNYYQTEARAKFLKAALDNSEVSLLSVTRGKTPKFTFCNYF